MAWTLSSVRQIIYSLTQGLKSPSLAWFLWLSWHLLGKKARWAEKGKWDDWEGVMTRITTLMAWPQGTLCWLPSPSQREPCGVSSESNFSCGSFGEWPVRSQWRRGKWNGADVGKCQENRGCTSLHDQILTGQSQKAWNLIFPGALAASAQAMRQDTTVQGKPCFSGSPWTVESYRNLRKKEIKTRPAAPLSRGETVVFP